jgi:hypothetical protein
MKHIIHPLFDFKPIRFLTNISNSVYVLLVVFVFAICNPLVINAQTTTNYLYLSDPSQSLDRTDPVSTSDLTTAQTATLSSMPSGVSIDALTSNTSILNNITVAHTTGTGSNRLMLVGISQKNKTVTSVTYGGVPLTLVVENNSNGNARVAIFRMINPPSGNANVVVTFSAAPDKGAVVSVATFTGVDQTTPISAFTSAEANSAIQSLNITSASGELVFDVISKRNRTIVVGSGQTELWNLATGSEIYGGGSTKPGAASTNMTWTATSSDWCMGAVSIKPAVAQTNTIFTQVNSLCSSLVMKAGNITVSNYISVISGTMPANPNISAVLKYGATTIISLSNPTYNSGSGLMTWTGNLGADVSIAAGQSISLTVTTAQSGVSFKIDYDSQSKPSKIAFPTSTYVNVDSLNVYNAPYPGGNIVSTVAGSSTTYVRFIVSDPYNVTDITSADISIIPPGTTVSASLVATSGCTRTYEYAWSVPAGAGSYSLTATAKEGYENTVTNSRILPVAVCSACPPAALNDNASGASGTPILINAIANDYDLNNNINPASITIVTQPNNGTGYISNNQILYLPNGSFSGLDTIIYQICDNTAPAPLCATALIVINVSLSSIDPCVEATKEHIYYIPYPEQDAYTALLASSNNAMPSNNIQTIISLTMPYPNMVITWDEWEDGYEANIMSPTLSTTKVWGDGNLYNGIAPGFADDIIPAGGGIILNNTMVANPRNSGSVFYDGKDKIVSSGQIALTQVCGEPGRMPVQAIKTNVSSVFDFGKSFTIPVGQNFNSQDFMYTALFLRASQNNTTINIDKNNDGIFETTTTLNEGGTYFINGGVLTGATIASDKPIGVELNSGGVDNYSIRNAPIFPATWYSNVYYTPVPTSDVAGDAIKDSSVVMLYNSLNRSINVNWTSGIPSNGVITIPAKTVVRFPLNYSATAAYKFVNPTGESFTAIEIVDSYTPGGGGNSGSTYDWSFNLIAESKLTDYATLAWAPGSFDGTRNDNPVWVTPNVNTTVYVKYNGDIINGATSSPCGLKYDVSFPLNALNYIKIKDPNDNDQSGIAVYTCNGAKLAAVYGEDPSTAVTGSPSWDVGATIQSFCKQKMIFANNDFATTLTNNPVTINVLNNDIGFLAVVDPTSVSNTGLLQPKNGTVSVNANGTILYTPFIGFTGFDTLEYNVCSTPSPVICNIARVVIEIKGCPSPVGQNIISGQVFSDKNKDGIKNDGGEGFTPSKVYLYVDGNCNSTIDANELKDSVSVDSSGTYQFVLYPEKIISDDFDGAGGTRTCANGSDGNTDWLTNWIDSGDGSSVGYCVSPAATVANTDVEIIKDGITSFGLRLKDRNKAAIRSVNLSGSTSAFLSFSYKRKSTTFIATDSLKVQVSTNGTTYSTIFTILGNGVVDAGYINVVNQNISSFISATTFIRFLTGSNTSTTDADTIYIDNVKINFIKYPQCYITRIDPLSIPANYYLTTTGQRNMSIANGATCFSNYDFGTTKNSTTISGTLFNDNNGLSDGLVNGTAFDGPAGTTLYAYLVDTKGKIIFKDTLNNGNGTYSFPKADVFTTYTVLISSTNVPEYSSSPDSVSLPQGWVGVGDAFGINNISGSGNEGGIPDVSIPVRTGSIAVTGVNFGIQKPNGGLDKSSCYSFGNNNITMGALTTPGAWSAVPGNPGAATITNTTSATTTITNFSANGIYYFLWTTFGVKDTVQVIVTKPDAGSDFNECGGGISSLTGNYSSGNWTAQAGNPAGAVLSSTVAGNATVTFANTANGNYNYIFTVNGCTDTVKIITTPKPVAASANSNLLTCINAAGYMAELSTSNPSPNSGIWQVLNGPGSIDNPLAFNTTIGSLSKTGVSTTVGFIVSDINSCTDTARRTITPPVMDSTMISKYSSEFCLTCPVIDGNTLSYYDPNGKLLSRVTDLPDSASIGSTVFCGQLPYNVSGNPAVSDVRTVKSYIDGVGVIPQPYLPRAWNINTTNDAAMTINLYFTDQEVAALQGKTLDSGSYYYFDNAPELLLVAYPNNSDTFIPAGSPNGIVYQPTFTRVNGYWEVTFTINKSATFYLYPTYWAGTALPVELIDLKATPLVNVIDVDWSTVSELNNLKFEIERSTNSKSFEKIGEVAGKGNSNSLIRYKFTDINVVEGVGYFYRIKQIDFDGKINTTDFVSAIIKKSASIDIDLFMPNPTRNYSAIKVNCSKPEVFNFAVFNSDGNKVMESNYELDEGGTLVRLDFSSLSNGLYLVYITSESGTVVRKLVVQK